MESLRYRRKNKSINPGLLRILQVVLLMGIIQASQATIINLDGHTHVKGVGVADNPLVISLGAGVWEVSAIQDQFTAFSPWSFNSNCNPSCTPATTSSTGYIHRYAVAINGVDIVADTWNGIAYNDPLDALANAASGISFTLNSMTDVEFYISTGSPLSDNRGGISLLLSQSSVPEPATLLLMGLGLVMLMKRRLLQGSLSATPASHRYPPLFPGLRAPRRHLFGRTRSPGIRT